MRKAKSLQLRHTLGGSITAQTGYSFEQFLSITITETKHSQEFESASKNLLLAESDMSLGYPYMPICAWIFK